MVLIGEERSVAELVFFLFLQKGFAHLLVELKQLNPGLQLFVLEVEPLDLEMVELFAFRLDSGMLAEIFNFLLQDFDLLLVGVFHLLHLVL